LLEVVYRGWFRNEAAWDLMAMVVVSATISMAYQVRHKALASSRMAKRDLLVGFVMSALVATIAAALATWRRG